MAVGSQRRRGGRRSGMDFVPLGAIAVVALGLLYLLFLAFSRMQTAGGYRMGVRFANASGLAAGAPVYLSGVSIGAVQSVGLLPDNTVEVILAITKDTDIPAESRIVIHSALAGSPDVTIVPPFRRLTPGKQPTPLPPSAILPKRILPIAQQPVGRPPFSTEELLAQSQSLIRRSGQIISTLHGAQHRLVATLGQTRANLSGTVTQMRALPAGLRSQLGSEMEAAKAQVQSAAAALKARDERRVGALSASMNATSRAMSNSVQALTAIRTDPAARANLRATMQNAHSAMQTLASATDDLRTIASNEQTKAQLKDAGLRLRAAMQRLQSLLHF
ncbi:MAG TPA: MlaD family protein [Candidatus Baltobacteraceae bacterium]|nr:MlaD family protein [Candidatus Baltobacteraceae bacterium]